MTDTINTTNKWLGTVSFDIKTVEYAKAIAKTGFYGNSVDAVLKAFVLEGILHCIRDGIIPNTTDMGGLKALADEMHEQATGDQDGYLLDAAAKLKKLIAQMSP